MNRPISSRRCLVLGCLTIPVLAPIKRARAQGPATPTRGSRAPFGLTWGISVESIPDVVEATRFGGEREGIVLRYWPRISLWRLPSMPPYDTRMVDLFFGHRNRLFRICAEGEPGQADAVITRYRELSSRLSELYGLGGETVTPRRWFRRDDPHTVLRHTSFSTDEVQVVLSLLSGFGDDVYWFMDYQHRAGFAEFQADRSRRERNAL